MSNFVVVYDRRQGLLKNLEEFDERRFAVNRRFELEVEHGYDPNIEIVLLAAPTRNDLLRTHARYFKSLRELAS